MRMSLILVILGLLVPVLSNAAEVRCAKTIFDGRSEEGVGFSVCLTDQDSLFYRESDVGTGEVLISFNTAKSNAMYSIKQHAMGEIRSFILTGDEGVTYTLSSGKSKKGQQVATMEAGTVEGCLDHVDLDPIKVKNNVSDDLAKMNIRRID